LREQLLSPHTAQPSQQPPRGLCRSTPPTARTACHHTWHRHTNTTRCQQHTAHTHGRPLAAPQPRSCSWTASQHIHHQSSDMTHRHTDTQTHDTPSTARCIHTHNLQHRHVYPSTSAASHRPTPLPHTHMHMPAAPRHPALLHTHTHTTTKLHTDTTRRHHPLCHRPQSQADMGG
jgi:hypothetical protein